jgi:hypothetical protein
VLADELTTGRITIDEYRERSEEILADAEQDADVTAPTRVHIPASAAWEAPTGEMTQIVGTRDETTLISEPIPSRISEKLEIADGDD